MSTKYLDYYQTLGVPRSASADEIQSAYRKLARQFHPDMNKAPEAEARFKQINEANEVLSDPEKRKRYDALGANWKSGQDFQPPTGRGGPGGPGSFRVDFGGPRGAAGGNPDFSDFFESLFGQGGPFEGGSPRSSGFDPDAFSQSDPRTRAGRSSGGRSMRRGETHEVSISITLADAFHGATRRVSLRFDDASGTSKTRDFDVRIPAGTTDGSVIRLTGQGEPGRNGGSPGDILLSVRIASDERFRIDTSNPHDLVTTLAISPPEAVLGAKLPLKTLDSEIIVTIPPGTQSGQRLRIRGKGLPKKAGEQGDLYVELRVAIPKSVQPDEKALYEQLLKVSNFDPRST